jgi:ABC-type branched-subunit amino acid transport system substrate-binding protein
MEGEGNMIRLTRWSRLAALFAVMALIAAACGGGDTAEEPDTGDTSAETTMAAPDTTEAGSDTTEAPDDGGGEEPAEVEPIVAGELAYATGPYGAVGQCLSHDLDFPVEEIINQDPPLGRPIELLHEDIGTVGEGQGARTLLERHEVDILISAAHEYRTYRDYVLSLLAEQDRPLMPTVHGGSIPGNIGGSPDEPIFRAQGLDEGLGAFGALYGEEAGWETVVIFATEVEGSQLAANAAQAAAEEVGIEVLARLDVQGEQPSYRTEAQQIADLDPDGVIVQAGPIESATLIRQVAESGLSETWVGEPGWSQDEFLETVGAEAIATQELVGFAAFSPQRDTPAWEFYSEAWNNGPYAEDCGPADGQYHFSTYDLMIITALAIEAAGSTNASDWAPAMFDVTDEGSVCYTYQECIDLLRSGEDIDYEGVTGPGTFTEGGINAVTPSVTVFNDDGSIGEEILIDAERALEVIDAIAVEADW